MLHIWMGRANTGKSGAVLERIRELGAGGGKQLLLVPEHASHQAEMDLCRVCGDGASLHCEAVSFRLLARRVMERTGGLADVPMDGGGKLLTMLLSLREVLPQLKVYARPSRKAPFLAELVSLCDELQAYGVQPEQLAEAAEGMEGTSRDKLWDLGLIYTAYLRRLKEGGADRRDLLTRLAEQLEESGYADGKDVFLDGFSYFNAMEQRILSVLLRRANSVTVTVLGERGSELEIFRQGNRTLACLKRVAEDAGAVCEIRDFAPSGEVTELRCLEQNFFGGTESWDGPCSRVELYRADTLFSEVERAAHRILRLVREDGFRFRDIAVAARNLEEYTPVLEAVFRRYGVPLYLSQRSDVLEKPVLSLIAGVLDSVAGGFEYEDMFRWLKTGLAGLSDSECDALENYVIAWDIHGAMWLGEEDWTANPDGWVETFNPQQEKRLEAVNALRRRIREPLAKLDRGLREQEGAKSKLECLWRFLDELGLAQQLEERTVALEELGELQQAREYGQLWQILCGVMDQFASILGDTPLDREEFARLFKLLLTQYDIGTIPVSLDQVQAFSVTRNDRHSVRCLLLLGANDHVLPAVQSNTGLLSREERSALQDRGIELAPTGMDLFCVELQNLYAALAQPDRLLAVSWPAAGPQGEPLRPSFVVSRLRAIFPTVPEEGEDGQKLYRLSAPIPALEMAGTDRGGALWQYFADRGGCEDKLAAMERAAGMRRGSLSPAAVESLYGRSYRMSASRIDKINSCHFAYFMQYGLRAKERITAGFDTAQVGTFIHYVLEHVTRRAVAAGGFGELADGELQRLIDDVIAAYMEQALPDFDGRTARFRYLFSRLKKTVTAVVENVARELTESDFVPVAFELDFSDRGDLPAISITADDAALTVVGKVDRVDGWLKDGKLYLRVVDYKSGKKAFDLSDVMHGLNIQMLLYLFTLQKSGKAYFGHEIEPAGVLYLPARDVLLKQGREADAQQLQQAMDKELRRSGLVLCQTEVLEAMEHSALTEPRFLPLAKDRSGSISKGIATAEELGKLSRYVDMLLEKIARELKQGNIDADPCGRSEDESACTYCEFATACHFRALDDGDHMEMIRPVSPPAFWQFVEETIGEEEQA